MPETITKQTEVVRVEVDSELEERIELTELNNLPVSMYMMLASDEYEDVRYSLASNANVPIAVLEKLVEDEHVYVSSRAKQTLDRIEREEVKARMSIVHYGSGVLTAQAGLASA